MIILKLKETMGGLYMTETTIDDVHIIISYYKPFRMFYVQIGENYAFFPIASDAVNFINYMLKYKNEKVQIEIDES